VVSVPGKPHEEISRVTSHMDIGTTLLQMLGAPIDTGDYSLGRNLFATAPRDYITIGDWHSIAVLTANMKYRIPYNNRGTEHWQPTTAQDGKLNVAEANALLEQNRAAILDAIQNSSRFSRKATAKQ